MPKISLIIPCLNEAENILVTLKALQALRHNGHEIILSDGGSIDNTCQLAQPYIDKTTHSPPGRARQMNAGSKQAKGDILCFLHADTQAPENIDSIIIDALLGKDANWGRFNIKLDNPDWRFRIIENLMNFRSCISGIATGDQGIFIHRSLFKKIGGFPDICLMEDIEISKRLKKNNKPVCIKNRLLSSARRWEKHGILRTVLLMWKLRFRYWLGTPPEILAKHYNNHPS